MMRTTGIIRRIDELGRVVIPKEIRRRVNINEGDPLEIFIEGNDTVCFRTHNPSFSDVVDNLKDQVGTYYDFPYEIQEKILALLSDVQELIEDEE